eukprot:TRINITY_DN13562_c0_g1_i1.p1 TRINITY_DN13562_c0_g1~~TRINITY_DN13562_c0_g1_i1.p1  ORF type:complete len:159 (+),score=17.12 TRINITY_DN13562_c0_g1_i1:54-530(+)
MKHADAKPYARWPGPAPDGSDPLALAEWVAAAMVFADMWEGPEDSEPGFHLGSVSKERLRTRDLPNLIKLAEKYAHWHDFAAAYNTRDDGVAVVPHGEPQSCTATQTRKVPVCAPRPVAAKREPERVPMARIVELSKERQEFLLGDWDRLLEGRRGAL